MRISVEMILDLFSKGVKEQEILQDYPELEPDDTRAALLYAHHAVAGETVIDKRMSDDDILEWAIREKRVIVATDQDFEEMIWRERRPH